MTPARDMSEALKIAIDKVGKDPDITVVPSGPSIIPDVV